jgi:ferredoxin
MGEAPEIFRVEDAGKVELLSERPAIELRAKANAAVEHCPTRALRIVED